MISLINYKILLSHNQIIDLEKLLVETFLEISINNIDVLQKYFGHDFNKSE